jgi:hypothetical protein
MAFNINEIKSQLTFGGAKATLFEVQLLNPVEPASDLKVPFMVQATTLPESTLGTIEIPYFGRKIKLAGDRTFGEWSVTVMNDEDFLIRQGMEAWMNGINSHVSNRRINTTYKSQAQVTQYGKDGTILRVYNFTGLFPTAVAPITMDWNATDDIERFDVSFQYDWWEIAGGATGTLDTAG